MVPYLLLALPSYGQLALELIGFSGFNYQEHCMMQSLKLA